MAKKTRYKFFDDVWNDRLNHTQKGLQSQDIGELIRGNDDIIYTIPFEEQYRPDNIAKKFYGNPKLYWVIVYANNISNSPAGFEVGKIIRIPRYERVIEIV